MALDKKDGIWITHAFYVDDIEKGAKFFEEVFEMRVTERREVPHQLRLDGVIGDHDAIYCTSAYVAVRSCDVKVAVEAAAAFGVRLHENCKNWLTAPDRLAIEIVSNSR